MADDAGPDPPVAYLYTGEWIVPRDVAEVEVHPSVTVIHAREFEGCDRLRSLLLPEGLLRIGRRAFKGCISLRSFRCPSTVTEIDYGAFQGCSNLAEVVLPEGLQSIEALTFSSCTSLREVRIPATVARIGNAAFFVCTNLRLVKFCEGLRWIGENAFDECTSLERLLLPCSVEDVGEEAFGNCSSLTSVQLQEDLGGIGRFAFRDCTSLERFRFVRLSQRMKAVALDERTASAFEGRLNEITNAMVGEADNPWEECKGSLRRAHHVLTYWELKGATTTLELALWRNKIEEEGETGVISDDRRMRDVGDMTRASKRLKSERNVDQEPRPSRKECRVKCGAGVVIPEVLKFFSYSTTW